MYAILDDADIVIGFELRDIPLCDLVHPNFVKNYILTDNDSLKEGDIYNRETGEFTIVPMPVKETEQIDTTPIPTEEDIIQSQILLNQQDLLIAQQSQDEVLAAILLAQQTV
ncbi:hypothetical protein SDC9_148486 [bioreactor metagenome]|uniref:Uncharacterized protein n=1 Tax=bioreactor metagenome TaxID=1076179 RepID=A0A645EIX1_9ZZZZ|nr:hypothetical protein [Candidatus Metalachnospira sp.]